ncbi:CdaR family protein [Thermoflavimicrobium dichotomicum]|uniref:YbbR domain-containing protein n=1 Tax=Thermoflavimicrobium dichotomicum TaxID=46223 RepID=A0A1I3TX01_9BACL|nr:CdaR family protein [Thermoflavimicrobium dichotomicum]SFJ74091.1 YbbR domain-containing protein [Thermoflavimicrobium dichotomicum]
MNKWLENDIVLRIISVGLAIILWFSVSESSFSIWKDRDFASTQTRIEVPVEAKYDQDQYELVKLYPNKVQLVLTGDEYLLERLSFNYRVFVDLRKLGAGRHHDVPLQIEGIPLGIDKKLNPASVDVILEEKLQKEVPVQVDLVGNVTDGYKIGTPIVSPDKVLVSGTKSQLDEVKSVRAVVQVGNLNQVIKKDIRLQPFGDQGPLSLNQVSITPEVVHVEIPMSIPNKKVPLKVEIAKGPPLGYAIESLTFKPSEVTVFGPQIYLNTLDFYSGIQLDLSRVKSDQTLHLPVSAKSPAVKVEPKDIEIYVKMVPAETKTIENVPIQLTGIGEGLHAKFDSKTDGKLTVTVSGAPAILENLSAGDIKAYCDVSNLTKGKHVVPIRFNLPPYVKVENQETMKVNIELTEK